MVKRLISLIFLGAAPLLAQQPAEPFKEKVDVNLTNQIMDYRKIIGFRNVLVHGYKMIDDQIVWQTIQQHLPILKHQVENLLASFGPP